MKNLIKSSEISNANIKVLYILIYKFGFIKTQKKNQPTLNVWISVKKLGIKNIVLSCFLKLLFVKQR